MSKQIIYDGTPVTTRIEDVLTYDSGGLADLIRESELDPESINLDDLEKTIAGVLLKDTSKFVSYQVRQKMASTVKTIMLATGLGIEDIKEHSLKELYTKSVEALNGTADEYFLGCGINTTSPQMMMELMKMGQKGPGTPP